MNRLAAVALLASALLPAPALAEEAIRLARKDIAGSAWAFDEAIETKSRSEMTLPGKPPAVTETVTRTVRRGTITVLKVDEKELATSLRVAYDTASSDLEAQDGAKAEPTPFFLAGKTVTISHGEDGSLKHDHAGELPEEVADELDDFLPPYATIFPDAPVKPGAEWKPSPEAAALWLDLDEGDKGTVTCKLVGLRDVGGRRAAEIHVVAELKRDEDGAVSELKLEGPILVDIESGRDLEDATTGRTTLAGTQKIDDDEGHPVVAKVSGSGTITGKTTLRAAPK